MPLPSRNTSAGRPVVLDTALLPCSFLPPSAKETRSDCLCPDGCAPRGNVRYIAATLAAATILQTGSASTDKIGRASCRERVWIAVVGVSLIVTQQASIEVHE